MPREQINIPRAPHAVHIGYPAPPVESSPGGAVANELNYVEPALHVSWMGNEEIGMPAHMQAAIEVHRSQIIDQARWLEANPESTTAFFWTPELTRAEAQSLIRTTKRARDRVYGADE